MRQVLLSLFLLIALTPVTAATNEFDDVYQRGRAELHDGDDDRGIVLLREAAAGGHATAQEHLEHLYTRLETLRTSLLDGERELVQGQDELDRDIRAQIEREAVGYRAMAPIFDEGKAEDAANLLVMIYDPKEAAQILLALSDDRVGEIMRHLPDVDPDRASEYFAEYQGLQRSAVDEK